MNSSTPLASMTIREVSLSLYEVERERDRLANPKDFADWLNRRGWKKREPDALDAYLFALLKAARVLVQKVEQPSPPTTP